MVLSWMFAEVARRTPTESVQMWIRPNRHDWHKQDNNRMCLFIFLCLLLTRMFGAKELDEPFPGIPKSI